MRHYLYLLIFTLLMVVSCETELPEGTWSKEPPVTPENPVTYQLSIDKTTIVAKAEGSSEAFNITSDDSWTVSTSESWIKVSDTTGAGDKSVTVTVEANTGKEARSGSITVKGKSSGTKSISVSQSGKEYSLSVDKTEISVGAAESSETFTITSNDDWTVSTSEAWVKVSDATGNGNKTITFTIEANTNKEARTAAITITGKNSETNQTITVSQEGKDFTLSVDKTAIMVGSSGSTETITITSNDSWTASSDASWITLSATSGSGDNTLNVSISLNSTTAERTGIVTVKGTNSSTKTISISQEGKTFTLNVDKTSISVGADANTETFQITGDDTWTASSDASWATLSATSGSGDKTITVSISANSSTTARSSKVTVEGSVSGISKTITISQEGKKAGGGNGSNNGHEYVDLGLPSGLLWATCNVGASKPEDYGDYFAWGETSTKTTYDWSTYKYYNGSYDTFTKYNNSSSYGTVDNKIALESEDDAAHVNWGGSWRIPTRVEQDELRNSSNCIWTWTTQNGVKGYKVTSKKNGNALFLPAAGNRYDSSLGFAGFDGYYWSSSLSASDPNLAYCLGFSSSGVDWSSFTRSNGLSVRPVCASSE